MEYVASEIKKLLNLQRGGETVLEIGCGAGYLAQYFEDYKYMGIDKCNSLLLKHIKLLNNPVFCCDGKKLPFKNKSFDNVFCFSVFEYLNDLNEVEQVISEMRRVSKNKKIFIGNIRTETHTERTDKHLYDGVYTHLVIPEQYFSERFKIIEGYYEEGRYNILG